MWARTELYGVRRGVWRHEAAMAVAASLAERTYRLTDALPDLQNETSVLWRSHLARLWEFLAGDHTQHAALSRAVADFLVSPLNHMAGQDGPDDFDRPQTIASFSAVVSAIAGGVDLAVDAIGQLYEAIDFKYESEFGEIEERWPEVLREADAVRRVVTAIVKAKRSSRLGFTPDLLTMIKS